MKNHPEHRAWFILLTAFAIFCSCSLLTPTSIYWYIVTATEAMKTELTSVRGIVLMGETTDDLITSITDGNSAPINESLIIFTDDASQAILTFADDSSLTMYSDTHLVLRRAQIPQFSRFSAVPTQILVEVQQGRVRATASGHRNDLHFDIETPHAQVALDQGSFSVEVSEEGTQVVTRLGHAQMISSDDQVTLQNGQRAVAGPNIPLTPPLSAAKNLLSERNFGATFTDSWTIYNIDPIASVTTTVESVMFQGRPVLRLHSEGQDNVHSEVGLIQEVDKDVRDFKSLRLFAEVRLINQSLPGGGQLGSEFPIMIQVAYIDINGNDRDWFHGFYYTPPPDNYILYDQPDHSNERVARFIWYPYESVNLLTTLGPAKPATIKSIKIYASGWIYDAMLANISLLAEE